MSTEKEKREVLELEEEEENKIRSPAENQPDAMIKRLVIQDQVMISKLKNSTRMLPPFHIDCRFKQDQHWMQKAWPEIEERLPSQNCHVGSSNWGV